MTNIAASLDGWHFAGNGHSAERGSLRKFRVFLALLVMLQQLERWGLLLSLCEMGSLNARTAWR